MPVQVRSDVPADYIVRIKDWYGSSGSGRRRNSFLEWLAQADTTGAVQMTEVNTDLIARFSDQDTAFAAEILHGSNLDPHLRRSVAFPNYAVYRGPMDVSTLAELRDWIANLDENSWAIEMERMISPDTFLEQRLIVMAFRKHQDAFAFKMRWSLPRD
jgi:hypothetical protein